jgi:CspA family cold shock protein
VCIAPEHGVYRSWSSFLLERTRCVCNVVREGIGETRVTGTVKKVVADRGFGFISAEDGQEYFFHRSGVDSSLNFDTLAADERVSFEVERSDKGPRAAQVRAA